MKKTLIFFILCGLVLASTASADLIGYWSFDEAGGTSVNDRIGGNTAEWQSGYGLSYSSDTNLGYAAVSDGGSSWNRYFQVPSIPLDGATSMTMMCWFKQASVPNYYKGIMMTRSAKDTKTAENSNWGISTEGSPLHIDFRISGVGGFDSPDLDAGVWHHAALVWDATTALTNPADPNAVVARCYLDGALVIDTTDPNSASLRSAIQSVTQILDWNDMRFGTDPSSTSRRFNGAMDDFAFFNSALSDAEIQAIYDDGMNNINILGEEYVDYVNPAPYTGGKIIFGESEEMGNGGFETIEPYYSNNIASTVDSIVALYGSANDTCGIYGWDLVHYNSDYDNNGGWVNSSTYAYEGNYKLHINGYTGLYITSNTHQPFDQNAGDTITLEACYSLQTAGYTNKAYYIFDMGLATEREVYIGELDTPYADNTYRRARLPYTLTDEDAAATTIDVKMDFRGYPSKGQLRIDNVSVREYPTYVIDEDMPFNTYTFGVALPAAPAGNTVVPVTFATDHVVNQAKGSLNVDSLTYTTSNWNYEQNVTFTSEGNEIIDGDRNYYIALNDFATDVEGDPNFVMITVIDNEYPRFIHVGADELILGEGDVADVNNSFFIVLDGSPASDVTVSFVDSSGRLEFTPVTDNVFTPAEVNGVTAKQFIVTAVDNETLDDSMLSEFTEDFRIDFACDDALFQIGLEGYDRVFDVTILEDDCGVTDMPTLAADANSDCVVDMADFASMAKDWLDETLPNVAREDAPYTIAE